jgi:hypothetical protein
VLQTGRTGASCIIGNMFMNTEENRAGPSGEEAATPADPASEGPDTLGGNRLALRRLVSRAGRASDDDQASVSMYQPDNNQYKPPEYVCMHPMIRKDAP